MPTSACSSGKAISHRANVTTSKSYVTHNDFRFDTKTFTELKNAQAIAIAYDGLNPMPPMFCYLKPYYNDVNTLVFRATRQRRNVMLGFETILPFLRPIEHLIRDDSISEIMVNGSTHVFIERAGVLQEVPDITLSEKSLMVAVKNIARRLGDDISEQKPILDSRLPDGSRVAAVIPPCSIHGVTLTIRKFNSRHYTVADLVKAGSLDDALAHQLKEYVELRRNILISGGTGCGKTTMLNALGRFIPDEDRVLLIEDTSEIQLEKPNLVRFEARQTQTDLPAVTIRDLLKASLRHRPDRIILGEIRGGEAFDLLQLLNTGHSGTLSTVHASSAAASNLKIHELRSAKRRRVALPRDQDEHRRLAQRHYST